MYETWQPRTKSLTSKMEPVPSNIKCFYGYLYAHMLCQSMGIYYLLLCYWYLSFISWVGVWSYVNLCHEAWWSPCRVYSAWTIMRSIAIAKCSSTSAPMVSESGDAVSIGDCFMLASHGNWMRNWRPGPVIMLCFWLVHCKVGISNSAHLVPAELNELTILTDTYGGKLMEASTRPEPLLFETWSRSQKLAAVIKP